MIRNERYTQLYESAMASGSYAPNDVEQLLNSCHDNVTDQEFFKLLNVHSRYGAILDMYRRDNNINLTLENRIHGVTQSVSFMDLLYQVENVPEEQILLQYFINPVYSILCQFEEPWVKDCIYICMNKWNDNQQAFMYIKNYLESVGKDTSDMNRCIAEVVNTAPTAIKNDPAPDIWKAYYLLHEVYKESNPNFYRDATNNINNNKDCQYEYYDSYQDAMQDEMPDDVANQYAYEQVSNKHKDIFTKAGSIVGRVVNMKYECAKNYNDAIRASLGENADDYFAHQEARKRERQATQQFNSYQQQQRTTYSNYFDPRYNYSNNQYSRNFAPRIPMEIIGVLINVLLIFISVLLAHGMGTVFTVTGLVISGFGWIRKIIGEKNALVFIAAGYAIALMTMLV